MYTDQEFSISNKSYTDKDFQSIFPELLDAVKKLTNKWDPSSSNESDPGVVLLKIAALIADKCNYNIDKNILETFPLSVTQIANARKLYDMLGYNMGWYKAAITDVTFSYVGSGLNDVSSITIPKYTMVTDDSGEIVYTLIDKVVLSERGKPKSCTALLGTIVDYDVNGVKDITIDNLDSENRLFFSDMLVALNGIFISSIGGTENLWLMVNNLEVCELNTRVYKFGILPNTNTCYIQFPQDIGNLIGAGLNIKYLITNGLSGNVQANVITSFSLDFIPDNMSQPINSDVMIKNTASTTSGRDPEDIDEAYYNYKRTIGTFETLVTILDYENALYRMSDGYGNYFISNGVVSDRTCDLNYTTKVMELTESGIQQKLYIDKEDGTPLMSAFDIGLYILSPMVDVYDKSAYYNKSFMPTPSQLDVISQLSDYKTSSHDFIVKDSSNNSLPYILKNFYTLNGKVSTYYKVTKEQAEDIEDNIKKELFKKYNARKVSFGKPLDYDDLVNTIKNSDTRISSVMLSEPDCDLMYCDYKDSNGRFESSHDIFSYNGADCLALKLLAKMVLSGNVLLYKFDTDINYTFGQTNIKKYAIVSDDGETQNRITTKSVVGTTTKDTDNGIIINSSSPLESSDGYTVVKNQNLLAYAPNLYVKTSYTSYVNYNLSNAFYGQINKTSYSTISIGENEYSAITIGASNYALSAVDDGSGLLIVLKKYSTTDGINGTFNDKEYRVIITSESTSDEGDSVVSGSTLITDDVTIKQGGKVLLLIYLLKNGSSYEVTEVEVTYYEKDFDGIPQNVYYQLKGDEVISINYTDANNVVHNESIGSGKIIKFTDTSSNSTKLYKTPSTILKNNIEYSTLTATQLIDVLAVNMQNMWDVSGSYLRCLWFTNDYNINYLDDGTTQDKTIEYYLFKLGENERLLLDGEYFIYTDNDNVDLVILGSGTLIVRNGGDITEPVKFATKVDVSEIISDGSKAIKLEDDWYTYKLSSQDSLIVVETLIITFGEGSVVKCDFVDEDKELSITPKKIINLRYKEKGDEGSGFTSVDSYSIGDNSMYENVYVGWKILSKLNLMMSGSVSLELLNGLSIEIVSDSGSADTIFSPDDVNLLVVSNKILALSGGEDIQITSLTQEDLSVNIYTFEKKDLPTYVEYQSDNKATLSEDSNGSIYINYKDFSDTRNSNVDWTLPFSFYRDLDDDIKLIRIPIRLVGALDGGLVDIQAVTSEGTSLYADIKFVIDFKSMNEDVTVTINTTKFNSLLGSASRFVNWGDGAYDNATNEVELTHIYKVSDCSGKSYTISISSVSELSYGWLTVSGIDNCISELVLYGGVNKVNKGALKLSGKIMPGESPIDIMSEEFTLYTPFIGAERGISSDGTLLYMFQQLSGETVPDNLKTVIVTGDKSVDGCFINNDAFKSCSSITKISLPDNLCYVGLNAFYGVSNDIFEKDSYEGTTYTYVGNDNNKYLCLVSTDDTVNKKVGLNSKLQDGLKIKCSVIGFGAFSGYSSESNVLVIPDHVLHISDKSFSSLTNAKIIVVSNGVRTIGKEAFKDCDGVELFIVGKGILKLGEYCFDVSNVENLCTSFTSLYPPKEMSGTIFGGTGDNGKVCKWIGLPGDVYSASNEDVYKKWVKLLSIGLLTMANILLDNYIGTTITGGNTLTSLINEYTSSPVTTLKAHLDLPPYGVYAYFILTDQNQSNTDSVSRLLLNKNNPVGYIIINESVKERFGGILIVRWLSNSESSETLVIDGIYVTDSTITAMSNIGYYSNQVETTLRYIDSRNNVGLNDIVSRFELYISNDSASPISSGNEFVFNRTYIVEEHDKIDTDVTQRLYKDNLFVGDAIWDLNHICSKYTIPQINTNTLSIKVMSQSIK